MIALGVLETKVGKCWCGKPVLSVQFPWNEDGDTVLRHKRSEREKDHFRKRHYSNCQTVLVRTYYPACELETV